MSRSAPGVLRRHRRPAAVPAVGQPVRRAGGRCAGSTTRQSLLGGSGPAVEPQGCRRQPPEGAGEDVPALLIEATAPESPHVHRALRRNCPQDELIRRLPVGTERHWTRLVQGPPGHPGSRRGCVATGAVGRPTSAGRPVASRWSRSWPQCRCRVRRGPEQRAPTAQERPPLLRSLRPFRLPPLLRVGHEGREGGDDVCSGGGRGGALNPRPA